MKVHLEKVHGLAPFFPERSVKDWVFAQLRILARQYVEAELAGDKHKRDQSWKRLIALYGYHRGLFCIDTMFDVIAEERRDLERRSKQKKEA